VRYWIKGQDEDFDREMSRAYCAGESLPVPELSAGARVAIAAMVAIQVAAFAAIAFIIVDWLRA
jgi:hypothetical protein